MAEAIDIRKRLAHEAGSDGATDSTLNSQINTSIALSPTMSDPPASKEVLEGDPELPSNFKKDWLNIVLLVVLYLLQGVPVGLAFGSIPFLLKAKLSYAQIGVFSLASYPYSLKLLWSPLVDSLYSRSFGRRKTWIVPIQLVLGTLFWWLSRSVEDYLENPAQSMLLLTATFFTLVLLSATQDIAVDGWALTLLSKENMSYASTCQTIGLNTGYFLSFTVFLAFNSAEFSNKYLRTVPSDVGVLPISQYLAFWGVMYYLVTLWLLLFKTEGSATDNDMGISDTYRTIWNICRLPHMATFIIVMLTCKVGFIANEAVTGLKLLEKGVGKEDLALAVLVDFPFQIIFGYYAAQWSRGKNPMRPWLYAFYGRLLSSAIGMLVVYYCPAAPIPSSYFALMIASTVAGSFMSNVQFVSISVFMTNVADPTIGGTYMTLMNTISNFGGTWPKYFILEAVDYFTESVCSVPDVMGEPIACLSDNGKQLCTELQGRCQMVQDGYYFVSAACVVLGAILFLGYIQPRVQQLVRIPVAEWHLKTSAIDSHKKD